MPRRTVRESQYEALAEIRYRLRQLLVFSEAKAREVGLEPALRSGRHHRVRRGTPPDQTRQRRRARTPVGRQGSRGEAHERSRRREVGLAVAPTGRRLLERLAIAHTTELRSLTPVLVGALGALFDDA